MIVDYKIKLRFKHFVCTLLGISQAPSTTMDVILNLLEIDLNENNEIIVKDRIY